MRRDYRLYELHDDEFERLVVRICVRWFGEGVTPFAPGKDGGRDGKFHGTAIGFPSTSAPLSGHVVFQAKHVNASDRSCSDRDFVTLLRKEHAQIKRLAAEGLCDHYILFTNRKYSGGADEKLIKELLALGIKSAEIVGTERLSLALDDFAEIRNELPNRFDPSPFRFEPDELVEVIRAIHDYTDDREAGDVNGAEDFEKLKLHEKNKINGLSASYYESIIVDGSMPHFGRVDQFLKNPRNAEFAELYYDAADELKQKIFVKREEFASFDFIFGFLYEEIQCKRTALRGRRRLISVILHHMYCNCDIGLKEPVSGIRSGEHVDA
ncbi:ABC-three component system protein [Mesorhizobium sp. M1322]|uniref:ABC-three component system protein n=1 Tax=Mesorhizobium sp. M1322 TaxID=2957081 RepID=UPI00333A987E